MLKWETKIRLINFTRKIIFPIVSPADRASSLTRMLATVHHPTHWQFDRRIGAMARFLFTWTFRIHRFERFYNGIKSRQSSAFFVLAYGHGTTGSKMVLFNFLDHIHRRQRMSGLQRIGWRQKYTNRRFGFNGNRRRTNGRRRRDFLTSRFRSWLL